MQSYICIQNIYYAYVNIYTTYTIIGFVKGCVNIFDLAVLNMNKFSFDSQWWEYSPSVSALLVLSIL